MPMPHAVDRPQPGVRVVQGLQGARGLQGLQGLAGSAPGGASIRRGRLGAVAIGILLASLAGGGCRSGVRSMSAPKWPSFGASKPKGIDDTALTAAPKIDAPTTKPSAAATPYPTTSTPAGYVVNEASPTAGVAAVGIQTPATDPATVTYGVAPPPQLAAAAGDPRSAPTPESAPPQSISPQVGPYATLPTPPPPAETPAVPGLPPSSLPLEPVPPPPAQVAGTPPGGGYPLAPPATPSSFPSTAGYEPSRVADARGSLAAEPAPPGYAAAGVAAGAAAAATLSPINPPESGTPARYASDRSRFGDPGADPALTAPGGAFPASPPADAGWSGSAGLPAAAPGPFPAAPAALPAANPDGLTSPPVRRPDPVFRPGGTSSYRPAEQIFVDEQPVAPSAVRTASYETLLAPLPAGQE